MVGPEGDCRYLDDPYLSSTLPVSTGVDREVHSRPQSMAGSGDPPRTTGTDPVVGRGRGVGGTRKSLQAEGPSTPGRSLTRSSRTFAEKRSKMSSTETPVFSWGDTGFTTLVPVTTIIRV